MNVIELGRGIAAAYAGKLLRDAGCRVDLVEPVEGHPLRRFGPRPREGVERGAALFQYLAAGKHSHVVDQESARDRDALREIVTAADIIVEDLGPGAIERHGIARTTLGATTALVRISAFGQSGPYRDRAASSLVVQAAGGWVARIGTPESKPYYVGGRIEEYVAGSYAAAAALTAAADARTRGQAIEVDVSTFDCIVGTIPYPMLQKITFDRLGFPVPQRYQPIPGILPCADGHVGISALTGQHWADICALLELPTLAEKMREVTLRGAEWREFLTHAEPWLAARSAAEIVELFQTLRVPAVPIGNGSNLPLIEPFASRGLYVKQPESQLLVPRSPLCVGGAPGAAPRAAPRIGEHELAAPQPTTRSAPSSRRSSWGGGRDGLAFSGLKVLDLTTFWAGPYFTMYLASFGADVVKVESPKRPEGFRFVAAFPQLGERWWEQSGVFHATNLGKRDLTLDLDHPRGKAIALKLAAGADIVAENFSPRVVEHFGLDYDAIRAVNPRAIMVRMPGFGLSGPCRDWVGWALSFEQMAGLAEITGEENGRRFAPGGFADPVVGMHAAVAVQAALAERELSGAGKLIEITQVEAVAAMTAEQVLRHSLTGEIMTRHGNRSPDAAPQGVYRGGGNDEWIALTVRDENDWQALCRAIGAAELARDVSLASIEARRLRHDEIDRAIEAWSSTRSADEAERALLDVGIPAARLLKTEGFYGDRQLVARGHFRSVDHPVCGPLAYPSWPVRFSAGPREPYASGAPTLGQHNDEILRDVLGLSSDEIAELRAARVIGETMA